MAKHDVKLSFQVAYDDMMWCSNTEHKDVSLGGLVQHAYDQLVEGFKDTIFHVEKIAKPEVLACDEDPMPYMNAAFMVEMVEKAANDQTRIAKTGGRPTDFVRALELATMAQYMRARLESGKELAASVKQPSLREKVVVTPDQPMNAAVGPMPEGGPDITPGIVQGVGNINSIAKCLAEQEKCATPGIRKAAEEMLDAYSSINVVNRTGEASKAAGDLARALSEEPKVEHLLAAKVRVVAALLRPLLLDVKQAEKRNDDVPAEWLALELEKIILILEKP